MSRSKREQQLKENERYPLRSLSNDARQALLHEEDLAEKRDKARDKRREEKKAEREEAEANEVEEKRKKREALKVLKDKDEPKGKKSWLH